MSLWQLWKINELVSVHFFFSVLLIKRLRIQPSLLAPSRLGRFAKRLFAGYLIDVLSLNSGRGGQSLIFP